MRPIIFDLIPSYLFKAIGTLFLFCAIFAKDDRERVLFLVVAYAAVAIAWFISNRMANRWFWRLKE